MAVYLGSNAVQVHGGQPSGGGTPTLETITKSYTPSETAISETITASAGYDGIEEVDVSVGAISSTYVGSGITQRTSSDLSASGATVTAPSGYYASSATKTISSGSATPASTISASSALVSVGTNTLTLSKTVSNTPTVSAGYISSGTAGNTDILLTASVNTRSSSDLTASGATVTAPAGYYASSASKAVTSGTAGTPTATKGTVSSHSISVTPSVTNTTGYITGGTKTGTAVTVSASELVSGNLAITSNGSGIDVTEYATVSVSVSGGGGSSMTVATATKTLTSAASSIQFTGLSGEPTSFVVTSSANQTTGGTKVVAVVYDGTSCHGIDLTTQAEADTGFTQSYSSGTLTITATTASFQANEYKLVYTYGGTSSNIATADVQVGSGATSITFTGLDDEPDYFSCIFKSTFSTSSGYQRVMEVVYDGTNTYGHALDSSAKALTSWSYSYNNGTLVISSTGTNNGGYFHQPGYYQLTYAIGGDQTLQKKTATPTSSDQTITADTAQGYTALKQVVVEGVTCSNLTAANIKSGVTVKIGTSTDDDSVTSVTGTYTGGGGGGSKNVQVLQSTSRTNASSLTKVLGDLTVATTGTYDIYWSGGRTNTSTSYTWGTRLYVDGTGYDTENTTWTNNCQSNHLSNVSLTANQKLSVYARGRTGSYYTFAPMLVIIEA